MEALKETVHNIMSTEIQKIETEIENVILKVEKKLPSWLTSVCEKADVYVQQAELLMNNAAVVDFTKIVPSAEPAREAIISILQTLDKVFRTVDSSLQQGLLNGAGASITTAIHGQSVPANHFLAPYTSYVAAKKASA